MIVAYTDGSLMPSNNLGGWAWATSTKRFDSGTVEKGSSSNRMELKAIIECLKYFRDKIDSSEKIKIFTDSQYCEKGFKEWVWMWHKKGWDKVRDKNIDLWKELFRLKENVSVNWIKGHSGNEMNEFVDGLCSVEVSYQVKDQYYD